MRPTIINSLAHVVSSAWSPICSAKSTRKAPIGVFELRPWKPQILWNDVPKLDFLDQQTKISKTGSKLRNPVGYGLKTIVHLDPQEFWVLMRGIGILFVPCFHRNVGWYPGIPFFYPCLAVFGAFRPLEAHHHIVLSICSEVFFHWRPPLLQRSLQFPPKTRPQQHQAPAAPGFPVTSLIRQAFFFRSCQLQLSSGRERRWPGVGWWLARRTHQNMHIHTL